MVVKILLSFHVIVCQGVRTSPVTCSFLTFIVCLAFAPNAIAGELSLPVQSAGPGSSVFISALFTPGADAVSGLQFDLQYDSSAMSLIVTAGEAARISGKSIYYTDLTPNQRRFIVIGLNQNPIPGGSLIDLFLNLNPNVLTGVYPLVVSNVTTTGTYGQSVPTTGTNGAMTIQGTTGSLIQPTGVLNAASLSSGPVAPGEIVTLVGSGIGPPIALQSTSSASSTALDGTSVLFDGKAAPLLYAAPNQINAIVPYGVSGQESTQMLITSAGQVIAGFPLAVAAAMPAIFTLDSSGVGLGAILNQDLTINSPSNPADRGTIVVLYATGAGTMNPLPQDGQVTGSILAQPTLPVSVQIGGAEAEILYAGAAPGLVAGVVQVNCMVPEDVVPGDAVAVELIVGSTSSPPGVTLAVR